MQPRRTEVRFIHLLYVRKIASAFSMLQCHTDFISFMFQKNILQIIHHDAQLLQENVFLNLSKMPILVKIDPFVSEVKLDDIVGYNKMIQNKLKREKEEKERESKLLN